MQPSDFLASLDRHEQERAAQPDPQEEFARAQFQSVVDAVMSANKQLLEYMKAQKTVSVDNLPTFPDSMKTPDIAEVTKAVKGLEKALKPLKNDNSDVVAAIKALQLNPTYKPEIKVAPTPVTVKAPEVKVDAPDLSPITRAIKANKPAPVDNSELIKKLDAGFKSVKKAVDTKPTPVANTPTDPLILYTEADIDDVDASNTLKTVRYYGYTDNHGAWYIKKMDVSGIGTTGKSITYTFGQSAYATNWSNRTTLTYSKWGS